MARGSLAELETQLLLATNLGYNLGSKSNWQIIHELYGLLNGLVRRHSDKRGNRGKALN